MDNKKVAQFFSDMVFNEMQNRKQPSYFSLGDDGASSRKM